MKAKLTLMIIGLGTLALAGAPSAQPRLDESRDTRAGEARHSGRLVEVRGAGSGVVIEEMLAWTGPGTGVVDRSIQITPNTSIRLLQPTSEWRQDQVSMPGWDARMLTASDLRPGDFVTVTTDTARRDVATALQVVRPEPR
jgi:hypothetical protein